MDNHDNILEAQTPGSLLQRTRRFHRGIPLIIALILAVIAVFAFTRASSVGAEESVLLSNGQTVQLGQTAQSVVSTLKSDVYISRDRKLYQYPRPRPGRPVEVLMYVANGKIVAIEVVANTNNRHKQTQAYVGIAPQTLAARAGSKLAKIGKGSAVNHSGYKIKGVRSSSYYLTSSCAPTGKVSAVAVALAGSEARLGLAKAQPCTGENRD